MLKDDKWRVIHVTTAHMADDVRIFDRQCRSLSDSGLYDVYLAAPGSIPTNSKVTHLPLKPIPARRSHRFIEGPRQAHALSKSTQADLWHFHDPELLPVAIMLLRRGEKVIWDAHEDYVDQLIGRGSKTWVPIWARGVVREGTRLMLKAIDSRATGIIAATPTIASRYRNLLTTVVGNQARLETFAACQPSFESKRILFTGSPGPGHLFLEVVEALSDIPGAELAVAGREPNAQIWRRATELLGERLVHLGWLDRPRLAQAMSDASIGLLTYADVETNKTNSPNKAFEFAASGLPIVATPTESNRKLIAEAGGGLLAEGFGSLEIRDAVRRLLSDNRLWNICSNNAKKWAKDAGSWTHSEERLLDLYRRILDPC